MRITRFKYITPESESVEAAKKSGDNVKVFPVDSGCVIKKDNEEAEISTPAETLFHAFEPVLCRGTKVKGVGVIYYPGGKVKPQQYFPIARSLAELGFHVAVVVFPLDLAPLKIDRAEDVLSYEPWQKTVKKWVMSGHSVGGTVACNYLNLFAEKRDQLKGVVLHAAYPAGKDDDGGRGDGRLFGGLTDKGVKVRSIWGTNDPLVNEEKIEGAKYLLPEDTSYIQIEGGNHTQFYYSDGKLQEGDGEAEISLNEQQLVIRRETHQFLLEIDDGGW